MSFLNSCGRDFYQSKGLHSISEYDRFKHVGNLSRLEFQVLTINSIRSCVKS